MYYWVAESDDGAYCENSKVDYLKVFKTEREAYEDMREAALQKMKWKTEYDKDFEEQGSPIGYEVIFEKNKIIHVSYSGTYTYEIKQEIEDPTDYVIVITDTNGNLLNIIRTMGNRREVLQLTMEMIKNDRKENKDIFVQGTENICEFNYMRTNVYGYVGFNDFDTFTIGYYVFPDSTITERSVKI